MKWNSRLADNTETWKLIQYYFALHPLFIKSRLKMERFEFKIKISLKLKLCVHFKRLFYPVNFFFSSVKDSDSRVSERIRENGKLRYRNSYLRLICTKTSISCHARLLLESNSLKFRNASFGWLQKSYRQ